MPPFLMGASTDGGIGVDSEYQVIPPWGECVEHRQRVGPLLFLGCLTPGTFCRDGDDP